MADPHSITLIDILIGGRARIEDPANWYKGHLYLDRLGAQTCDPAFAVCFCAAGAVLATAYTRLGTMRPGSIMGTSAWCALDAATRIVTNGRIGEVANFNDEPNTTHDQILAVFDHAITTARKAA